MSGAGGPWQVKAGNRGPGGMRGGGGGSWRRCAARELPLLHQRRTQGHVRMLLLLCPGLLAIVTRARGYARCCCSISVFTALFLHRISSRGGQRVIAGWVGDHTYSRGGFEVGAQAAALRKRTRGAAVQPGHTDARSPRASAAALCFGQVISTVTPLCLLYSRAACEFVSVIDSRRWPRQAHGAMGGATGGGSRRRTAGMPSARSRRVTSAPPAQRRQQRLPGI